MFTEMLETVDTGIRPFVIDQWRTNRGVSGAWNLGMKKVLKAGYKHAFILNDDLKFPKGSIDTIWETLLDTGAALVSPTQVRPPVKLTGYKSDVLREGGADFFCFAIDIEQVIDSAGWFDENFYPAYFEDNDMHRRMILSGLTTYVHDGCEVFHEGSKTQNLNRHKPVTNAHQFESNKAYFALKWGGRPHSGDDIYMTPFNNPGLSLRDWYGSWRFDDKITPEARNILETVDYEVKGFPPQMSFHVE